MKCGCQGRGLLYYEKVRGRYTITYTAEFNIRAQESNSGHKTPSTSRTKFRDLVGHDPDFPFNPSQILNFKFLFVEGMSFLTIHKIPVQSSVCSKKGFERLNRPKEEFKTLRLARNVKMSQGPLKIKGKAEPWTYPSDLLG